jgi:hypothetical protein
MKIKTTSNKIIGLSILNAIVAIILFCPSANAQSYSLPNNWLQKNNLQIGVNFSFDYSNNMLVENIKGPYNELMLELQKNSENHKIGYSGGFRLQYKLSKHINIEAGLGYSNKGYQINKNWSIIDAVDSPDQGAIVIFDPNDVKIRVDYHYLDLPILLHFNKGNGKIGFISTVGLTTNILLSKNYVTINEETTSHKSNNIDMEGYNRFNLSPCIGAGIIYKLANKSQIRIEPIASYGLIKTRSGNDYYFNERLWSLGLNLAYYIGSK